jgi:hypothetical protein
VKTSSWDKRATSRRAPRGALALCAGFAIASAGAGCGGSGASSGSLRVEDPSLKAAPGVSFAGLNPPVDFVFDSLDDRPVSAEATRDTPTVLAFVTTSSLSSQAQVDFLVAMAKHDLAQASPVSPALPAKERVHYAVVALETNENREMVAMYEKALSIPFPVALADAQTLAGAGPFGDVTSVPVTVVLDRAGRVAWRNDGHVAKSGEIRAILRGL